MPVQRNTPAIFWSKVDTSGACWLWQGHRESHGYGVFHFQGKPQRAHRLAWLFTHGDLPADMVILHRCDNPSCVRPDHLALGTHQDNIADKVAKDRQARGDANGARRHPETRARGERGGTARLTAPQVREIRHLLATKQATQTALATTYGVHQTTISLIACGKKWRHLLDS